MQFRVFYFQFKKQFLTVNMQKPVIYDIKRFH